MSTISDRIAAALHPHITELFGLMGNGNAYFIDAALRAGLRYTAVRHEAGGVAAADAYYRTSGRVAIATATYGPGFTNAITPLAESAQARIPSIFVVGDAPTTGPRPWDIDQSGVAAAIGVKTFVITAEEPAETAIAALEHALGRRTPVVLAIPYDLGSAEAFGPAPAPRALRLPAPVLPEPAIVRRVADRLRTAKRPFVLAGAGARWAGAASELGALADKLAAVTGTTAIARGIFGDSPADLGVVGGFGQQRAMELIREADVALVAGASLNQFTNRFGELFAPDTVVIQVDIADVAHPRADEYLHADARLAIQALLAELAAGTAPASRWSTRVDALADGAVRRRPFADEFAPDGRLDPRAVAIRLDEIMPADRVIVSDGGHFIGWANSYWAVREPHRLQMVGTAFQTIGLGLPSAVGAGVAHPDSLIVLTTGDGGALMGLADLPSVIATVRHGLIVVWNDAAYTAEVSMYGARGLDVGPMLIPEVDFAAVGAALGARSVVVQGLGDLAPVAEWIDGGAPGVMIVDCRISPSIIAPYQEEIMAASRRASGRTAAARL